MWPPMAQVYNGHSTHALLVYPFDKSACFEAAAPQFAEVTAPGQANSTYGYQLLGKFCRLHGKFRNKFNSDPYPWSRPLATRQNQAVPGIALPVPKVTFKHYGWPSWLWLNSRCAASYPRAQPSFHLPKTSSLILFITIRATCNRSKFR